MVRTSSEKNQRANWCKAMTFTPRYSAARFSIAGLSDEVIGAVTGQCKLL